MAGLRALMASPGFRAVLLAVAVAFVVADIAIAAIGLGGPGHRSVPPVQPGQVQVPTTTAPAGHPTSTVPRTTTPTTGPAPTTTAPGPARPGGTTVPPAPSPAGGTTPTVPPSTLPYTL